MSYTLKFGDPFLYFNAASCQDHDQRLSGPAPAAPPAAHEAGTDPWNGPYGDTIETWDDTSHPPANAAHPTLSYTAAFGTDPVRSWLFGSDVPDGYYTVKLRKRKNR